MKNLTYYTLIIAISCLTYFYIHSSEQNNLQTNLEDYRQEQQVELSSDSIIRNTEDLNFFPANKIFQSSVKIEQFTDSTTSVEFQKSKVTPQFTPVATITFEFEEKKFELTVFKSKNNDFIIPFKDKTNNTTTSKYGRLIPYHAIKKNNIIDFNLAFNPACEYASKFDCLKVPKSNHLPISIEAGEKRFED